MVAFFQAEELNLDLGQRKGFPFGNTGVLCLPDTMTSRVLVGTLAKTKIRVAFSHPSAYPGWWGPRRERLSGTIVTGSAQRMLVTLSPKSAVAQLQTVRKQFLANDLRLISQEKKKRKIPGKAEEDPEFPGQFPRNLSWITLPRWACVIHDTFAQTHRNKYPDRDSLQWIEGWSDWTAPAQRMMDEDREAMHM